MLQRVTAGFSELSCLGPVTPREQQETSGRSAPAHAHVDCILAEGRGEEKKEREAVCVGGKGCRGLSR